MSTSGSGRRGSGCVTNFDHGDQKLTVWDTGSIYRLSEFGVLGQTLPQTDDPIFQSLAKEMHRLACEIGRLRRVEIEAGRERDRSRKVDDNMYIGGPGNYEDSEQGCLADLITDADLAFERGDDRP